MIAFFLHLKAPVSDIKRYMIQLWAQVN